MTTIIIFVLILGLLVLVHELGHFIVAKKAGAKIEEFGIGFPPRLFSVKKGETRYSLNLIPLGGFVKILGEDGDDKKDPRSFASLKYWKKVLVLIAGVSMNMVLAAVLLSIGFKIGLPTAISDDYQNGELRDPKVQVLEVTDGSPAKENDIQIGDQILTISGHEIQTVTDVQQYINENKGVETTVTLKRGDKILDKTLTPRTEYPEDEGATGVALVRTAIVSYPFFESIWKGIVATLSLTITIVVTFAEIIKNLLVGEKASLDVAGPVGIAVMTNQAAKMGIPYLLQFTALLSVNLAIINILPIPALDGGRLLFATVEKIRRKPMNKKTENMVHLIGFTVLMLLMVVVTFRDVIKFKDIFFNFWESIKGIFS
ncbi:RIP metalloprotease RseP [Patescibacteria group bacterium]|nr:RIP metalloprotease RseP [Patescibacteria group bacterium]